MNNSITGSVPGVPQSKKDTQEFTGSPKTVLAAEKSFEVDEICA